MKPYPRTSAFRLPRGHKIAFILAAGVTSALSSPLVAATVENINRTFEVKPGGSLVIDVDVGTVEIKSAPGNQVVVSAVRTVSGTSKDKEEEFLRDDPVTIEQHGNTVTLHAKRTSSAGSWLSGNWWHGLQTNIRYTVTVPETFNADAKSSGGTITVTGLTGEIRTDTSGGGLEFTDVTGPIDGHTSGGGIKLARCKGEVAVHTSGGGIDSTDGEGTLTVDTSGGGINIHVHRGDVKAGTSGGGINVDSIAGNLDAHTSGGSINATLLAVPTGECRLETSGGGVRLTLPENVAVLLDAATSGGRVTSDLPVTIVGKHKGNRLQGPINGGGPLVYLRSSGGSIHVIAGKTASVATTAH